MEYFNLHTHHYTAHPQVLGLVNQYPWAFDASIPHYSIGIHPWYIEEDRLDADLKTLEEKLQTPQCMALGECGLDNRIAVPMALQQEVFERQMLLAQKYQKPLVLHLVGAFGELLALHKRLKITVPIVLHGFSKGSALAAQLTAQGFYLSFGKHLLQNPDFKEVFTQVPDDRFFLETDTIAAPIQDLYLRAAAYRSITLEQLQKQIQANFRAVFGTFPLH